MPEYTAKTPQATNDPELDTLFGGLLDLMLLIGMMAVLQQLARLMPVTATGAEQHSELPQVAEVGQTHWNPEAQRLHIFLPGQLLPRTEVR